MKKTRRNIFEDVVTDENQMTELLRNLLQFKYFRDGFLKQFLSDYEIIDGVEDLDLKTQEKLADGGIPDLSIENDQVAIFCEIKTGNAPLTANQPAGYLDNLSQKHQKDRWLIFVVPQRYVYLHDIDHRLIEFFRRNKNCAIYHKIIYWNDVISFIDRMKLSETNPYIKEFRDMLSTRFEVEKVSFTRGEVNMMRGKEIPETIMRLIKIVESVKNLNQELKGKVYRDKEEYTVYFGNSKGNDVLYFGIWYPYWKEFGVPLSYGVNLKEWDKQVIERLTTITRRMKREYRDYEMWRVVDVSENELQDEDCGAKIADTIGKVVKELLRK